MKTSDANPGQAASELISQRIASLGDWHGATLSRMRKLIKKADPDIIEEWKWVKPSNPGTPVWSHDGIVCTGESYKKVVKLTFMRGAALEDPARLFNASLDGNARRAIDIPEGGKVDEAAFKALIRQAVALNSLERVKSNSAKKAKASPKKTPTAKSKPSERAKSSSSKKRKVVAAKKAKLPGWVP
jgi:hypothetical protein